MICGRSLYRPQNFTGDIMIPVNEKMLGLGEKSSAIREIFEYGNKRRAEIGAENVFDFSLGNPSVPAPMCVNETLVKLLEKEPDSVHAYTSGPGDRNVRASVAEYLNKTFGSEMTYENIYMTCGAAASLTSTLNAVINGGDEVIVFAPFFPEYRVFIEKAGGELVAVKCREDDLTIDARRFEESVTEKTKAVIINSPNNPTGVVISEKQLRDISGVLKRKSAEYGHIIYLISDEPYRELVYGGVKVPFVPDFYGETIICYSFSKSLSLPGERIGYIAVCEKATEWKRLFSAVCGAARSLGFVCAPSIFQKIVPECLGKTSDISVYEKNRNTLVGALTEYGYKLASPDGAFYLFLKSPDISAAAFCERAKKYEILLVPSDSFGFDGYVRIAYCVNPGMIDRALPGFRALAEEYKIKK